MPSSMWSKMGRLKRSTMPKLTRGSTIFGSGASPGIMSCIAGRLLCDTYLCSRDLLKEVKYLVVKLLVKLVIKFLLKLLRIVNLNPPTVYVPFVGELLIDAASKDSTRQRAEGDCPT